ncbi:Uncharacterised protein [Amycolatopsis camponoti]|uniref:Uncharacterized protein n=1 Tax=Amycolatopsis camponoti TaxID=2606593 RepID=A0A6I8M246_9PSEU|nr:hypothetical protein [Amycolatopsis camponoti]VVJ22742.1 Uncharacterised protein [Amycolatopsis camponoti]
MTGEGPQSLPGGAGDDETAAPTDPDVRWGRRARRTVAISQIVIAIAQVVDVVVKIFS